MRERIVSHYDCGCQIRQIQNDNFTDSYVLEYCPKHKAALEMYEALELVLWDLEDEGEVTMPTVDIINKAKAKAEGK